MKTKTILIAATMFFALTVSAFAQATFSVSSIPETVVTNSGNTEKTGDIFFTAPAGTPDSVEGTISISYGVPITVGAAPSPGMPGIWAEATGTGTPPAVSVLTVDNSGGVVVIRVRAGGIAPYVIRVTGVRVQTAGTPLTELSASISSTGNAIVAGQTSVRVINSIAAGIHSVTSTAASFNAVVSGAQSFPADIRVREGYLKAFGVRETTDTTQTISTMVRITLDRLPPSGVTLRFPLNVSIGAVTEVFKLAACTTPFAFSDANLDISSTSPSREVCYRVHKDTDPTLVETLTIPITVLVAATPRPLAVTTITATATLAPIVAAFPIATAPIPRYAAVEVGPTTLLTITPGTTSLLIPYATTAVGYDTGIAISNTTSDPGFAGMGFSGATVQSGRIRFHFYPQTGTAFTYTTAAGAPGMGLDATGSLASGRVYTVLLSSLLEAAGRPGAFSGYIIVVTEFTNAHGQCYISDFRGFTSQTSALVLRDRTILPESLDE